MRWWIGPALLAMLLLAPVASAQAADWAEPSCKENACATWRTFRIAKDNASINVNILAVGAVGNVCIKLEATHWRLPKSSLFVHWQVDNASLAPRAASLDAQSLSSCGFSEDDVRRLMRGRALRVDAGETSYTFPLTGSYAALKALEGAWRRQVASMPNTNPFTPARPAPAPRDANPFTSEQPTPPEPPAPSGPPALSGQAIWY
ncbi:hypothetical protein [Marinivivus vitaminiproducens]|uniref:hypothetical protein n=1 Tax=Marinivivus vitaminiproducens TaxID=3035935 RepID=UPI0027AAB32B|nr:hypothetical protein P4R82_07965 [Geminicoccaceae bacterium SCSIO 64248]